MDKLSDPILNCYLIHQRATGAELTHYELHINSGVHVYDWWRYMHFEFLNGYSDGIIPLQSRSLGL